ncbi:uncharacterized protein LOC144641023 isoform X2 [Oculina patagonica]
MDSFLRLLQITLIITQIYQSHQTSQATSPTSLQSLSTTSASSSASSGSSSSSLWSSQNSSEAPTTTRVTSENTTTTPIHPSTSINILSTSATASGMEASASISESNTPVKTTHRTTAKVMITLSQTMSNGSDNPTKLSSQTNSVAAASTDSGTMVQTDSISAKLTQSALHSSQTSRPSAKASAPSLTSSVSTKLVQTTMQMSSVPVTSKHPASNTSSVPESTRATGVSNSRSFSRLTHMPANYSSSSASRPESVTVTIVVPTTTKASSTVKSLTPPSPVSLNWTDWSVDERHCQKYCSEKGGTVTASRQCYSHSSTLATSVCAIHNDTTQVGKCGEPHCPISGTEAFRSFISVVAVGILLTKLATCV